MKRKLLNRISKRSYTTLKDAIKGELNYNEYKMAEAADLEHDEELLFVIESRKAKLRGRVVGDAVQSNKADTAFRLLADSDEERAKLNTRTEVKEDKSKRRQILIIHDNDNE